MKDRTVPPTVDLQACREENARLRHFRLAVETAGHAIYMTDPDGTITYVNPEFERSTGYAPEEALGRTPRILKSGLMSAGYYQKLWQALKNGEPWTEEVINRKKDGTLYYALQTIAQMSDETGKTRGFVAVQSDITHDKELERELKASESRNRMILASMSEGLVLLDRAGAIVTANDAARKLLELGTDPLEGKPFPATVGGAIREDGSPYPADEHPVVLSLRTGVKVDEAVMGVGGPDGRTVWVSVSSRPIRSPEGETQGVVATFADTSDRKRRTDEVRRAAESDFLTGLKNRYSMDRAVREAVGRAARYGEALSVLFIDIDHFKRVNDRFGHDTGDAVLKGFAAALDSALRETDLAARWGGEEFLVLAPHTDLREAAILAERLRALIEGTPMGEAGSVTASIGVACFRKDDDLDSLIGRADAALYEAKQSGRNRFALEANARPPMIGATGNG